MSCRDTTVRDWRPDTRKEWYKVVVLVVVRAYLDCAEMQLIAHKCSPLWLVAISHCERCEACRSVDLRIFLPPIDGHLCVAKLGLTLVQLLEAIIYQLQCAFLCVSE